jgi:hypothetical protein
VIARKPNGGALNRHEAKRISCDRCALVLEDVVASAAAPNTVCAAVLVEIFFPVVCTQVFVRTGRHAASFRSRAKPMLAVELPWVVHTLPTWVVAMGSALKSLG